jgi:hypothetical protein
MAEPTIVRASSLSGYPDCPRRAAAKVFRADVEAAGYELRPLPGSVGAAVGTAVHAGAAMMLHEKAASGDLAPESAATDCAAEQVRETALAEGLNYDRETATLNEAVTQAVRMTRAYRRVIAPGVEPVLVEERLEAQVSPSVVLSGQSDVIAREPGRVRDLKTGKIRGNHKPQLGAYALLARSNGIDVDVKEVAEDFVRRVATARPQPEPQTFLHDLAAAETAAVSILRHIEGDITAFRNGDLARHLLPGDPWAFPANPNSKLCSEKWCPAWGTAFCREHMIKEES